MVSPALDIGFGLLLLVLWGYVMYLVQDVSTAGYGGKYTAVLPHLFAAFAILLLQQGVEVGYDVLVGGNPGEPFFFGLQTLQLVAGALLAFAVYQLYQIEYATTGFFGGESPEGEP